MTKKINLTEDQLYNLYITENKTVKEIAQIFAVSTTTISRVLKKYNLKKPEALRRINISNTIQNRTEQEKKDYSKKLSGPKNKKTTPWNKGKKGVQEAWNKGLKMDSEFSNKIITGLNKRSNEEKLEHNKKISEKLLGREPWNKFSSTTEEQKKKIQETLIEVWKDKKEEILKKQHDTKKLNNSFNTSKIEEDYYKFLLSLFEEEDVIRQYSDKRYPFACDFYIKSLDLFIELNINWTHGGHLYNPNNLEDQDKLNFWKEKAIVSKYYQNAIDTWTNRDTQKFKIAKQNKLNYLVFYNKEEVFSYNFNLPERKQDTEMIFKNEDEKDLATLWGVQNLNMTFDEYCQSIYKPITAENILDNEDYHLRKRTPKYNQPDLVTAIMKKYQWREFYKNEIEGWNKNPIIEKTGNHLYTDFLVNRFNNALTPKTKADRKNPLTALSLKNYLTGLGTIAHFTKYYSTFKNELMTQFIDKYNIRSIVDPCSGWGERLITCGLAKIKYTGVDINENLKTGYENIIADFNFKNIDMNFSDSAIFKVKNNYDTLFTCPPYWDTEIYTEAGAENLSLPDFLSWWDKLIKNYKDHINLFAYQIDNKHAIKMNKKLEENGFELIETIGSDHQVSNHFVKKQTSLEHKYRDNAEKVYVFKKVGEDIKTCLHTEDKQVIDLFEEFNN